MNKEGFYSIDFEGPHGRNFGVLVLETQTVVGVDSRGGIWNGTFQYNPRDATLDVTMSVRNAPYVTSSITEKSSPFGYTQQFTFKVSPDLEKGCVSTIETGAGAVKFILRKIRDLPN